MSEVDIEKKEGESPSGNGDVEQDVVRLRTPETKSGIIGSVKAWRNRRKTRKRRRELNREGYIQWFLIDGSYPEPMFIKPEDKGGGIMEFEHGDDTYLFPKNALVPSEHNGMWTAVHVKGDAEPVNLANPDDPAISSQTLTDYLEMRVTNKPPGLLDNLDVDSGDIMKYLIVGIIALAVLQNLLSGGGFV